MRWEDSHEGYRDEGKEIDGQIQHSGGKVNFRVSGIVTRYIDGGNKGDNGMKSHNSR